jgi:hypothetical protein
MFNNFAIVIPSCAAAWIVMGCQSDDGENPSGHCCPSNNLAHAFFSRLGGDTFTVNLTLSDV